MDIYRHLWASSVAQHVKNPLQCRRCGFNPWGQEDPLEEGMATHSRILARKIPWTEEPGGLWSMGLEVTEHQHHLSVFSDPNMHNFHILISVCLKITVGQEVSIIISLPPCAYQY